MQAKSCSLNASIKLALLGKGCDEKRFNYDKFFDPLANDICHLGQQGVFVNHCNNNLRGSVYCVCSDNVGVHSLAGFQEHFQAEYLCRSCVASKVDIQTQGAS